MQIPAADRLGETKEYYFSKKLREIATMNARGAAVINLGIGSPDRPPHKDVVGTLHKAALKENTHGYQSYKGAPELRKAFAEWYARYYSVVLNPDKEVLPLMGSKEGIMHLSMTFLNQGDEVLVPDPGYPSYRAASKLAGATCVPYALKAELNWQPNLEALEKQDLSKVKMMWLNYPQMPTGASANPALFKKLIAFAKRHQILLCHDNPYSFIRPSAEATGANPLSILSFPGAKQVAVELNSLSKSHNMAGWRVGVLAAHESIIQQVLRFKSNMDSGMFLPLQLAAAKALSLDEQWYKSLNAEYTERRRQLEKLLNLLGCSYDKQQQGLFIWAKIPAGYQDGYALSDFLLYEAHVFVTPGRVFGKNGKKYIRLSLCIPLPVIDKAIKRVSKLTSKSFVEK